MKNPFSPDSFSPDQLKRIPRDLSHRKVFTTEFGKGTPVLCQEVFPGDTVKIDNVDLKIQGMPTYFPLTSELKVSVSYFYCRNRCVDDDWEDFIFNTKEIDKAWLRMDNSRAKKMISTGSLGDFFGLPSTVGADGFFGTNFVDGKNNYLGSPVAVGGKPYNVNYSVADVLSYEFIPGSPLTDYLTIRPGYENMYTPSAFMRFMGNHVRLIDASNNIFFITGKDSVNSSSNKFAFVFVSNGIIRHQLGVSLTFSYSFDSDHNAAYMDNSSQKNNFVTYFNDCVNTYGHCQLYLLFIKYDLDDDGNYILGFSSNFFPELAASDNTYITDIYSYSSFSDIVDSTDDSVISNNIFVGNSPLRKVEAHAFRHYTMIGNYFFRNDRNNPYVLNGEVQYNKFIPTKASGPDDNVYDFFYRNWELDRFTSCCQTPQFGDAPLVGLTFNPVQDSALLTFAATDEDGVEHSYQVRVGVGEDYKLNSIADFDKEIPSTVLQNVTNMISYGTSINDIRVTNSFQRFLERAQRGLRYRHQMKSHLGVSVDYPDIDIPQYIGGFNGSINSFRNENTAASEYANLGDFNGSLYGNFGLNNPITLKVPEHGYIMGIMTITPVPMYPQSVTNKALLKRSPFEYPLQEFLKVGNVPVDYGEVMPLQNGFGQSPDDIYGYQRPFYEYLSNLDEVHGDFRTTLRQFNCVRMFAQRPELSADFTTVHPESLNQIFITNNIADKYGSNAKFMCLINYHMTALRQIPDGDPALE